MRSERDPGWRYVLSVMLIHAPGWLWTGLFSTRDATARYVCCTAEEALRRPLSNEVEKTIRWVVGGYGRRLESQ